MIQYLVGDATDPKIEGKKIIAHICNDAGGWGRGFVLSLSKKWKEPEQQYRRWFQEHDKEDSEWPPFMLGSTIMVPVTPDIVVANMIAQRGVLPKDDGTPPIRYGALEECLMDVEMWARDNDHATVHMPRIGCGLAGGKWSEIEPIIQRRLIDRYIETYVYDFDTKDARTIPWNK